MFKQKGNPFKVTPCGRRRNYMTSPLNRKNDTIYRYNGKQVNKRFADSIDVRDKVSAEFLSGAMRQGKFDDAAKIAKERPGGGKPATLTKELDGKIIETRKFNAGPINKAEPRRTIGKGKNFNKVAKDKSATGAKAGGGMTQKGVNEYKRKNPGSKLQTAVTKKPSELKPGSKDAKRRKSFCARSKSWKSERGKAARRRWNC